MKKKFLLLFYFVMTYLGFIKLFYWLNRNKKIILTYHNIIPNHLFDDSCHLGVSHTESVFKEQIKLIYQRFDRNQCLITFDDGYKNQLEVAAKILSDHHLQGIFFVSFQSLLSGQTLTIDRIMMWLSYVPAGNYHMLGSDITINNATRDLVAAKLYQQLIDDIKLWDVIEENLNNAFPFDQLSIDDELVRLRFKPLTADDLEILKNDGHLVGSHSWDHRPLGRLSLEEQKEDFSKCIVLANQYCNSWLYSYPFGGIQEVSPLTTKLCAESGFSSAFMNMSPSPAWVDADRNYTLPRLSLPNVKNKYLLDAKLSGFESFCKSIVRGMRSEDLYDKK